eukprot:PhM_4_TR3401/c0_g1_i1/m.22627
MKLGLTACCVIVCLFVSNGYALSVRQGVAVTQYNNSAFVGPALNTGVSALVPNFDISSLPLESKLGTTEMYATLYPQTKEQLAGAYTFSCFSNADITFVWVDNHLVCQAGIYANDTGRYDGTPLTPLKFTSKDHWPIRVHMYFNTEPKVPSFSMLWADVNQQPLNYTTNVPGIVKCELEDAVVKADELQRSEASGWGTWVNGDIFRVTHMPDAATLSFSLCAGSNITQVCDSNPVVIENDAVRVGRHTANHTYSQFYYAPLPSVNVSVEYYYTSRYTPTETFSARVSVVSCGSSCDASLLVYGSFSYKRVGTAATSIDGKSFTFMPLGLDSIKLSTATSPAVLINKHAVFPLTPNSVICYTTDVSGKCPEPSPLPQLSPELEVVEAATCWNYIYVPSEFGPLTPVSRSWVFEGPISKQDVVDWGYVIFDWDNYFASFMGARISPAMAISNYLSVMRSKTYSGFVPNYASRGAKSLDRTEPMIGVQVLTELSSLYPWLVDLVVDDLIDWHNWTVTRRMPTTSPYLVVLGSDYIDGMRDDSMNAMQGARFESGLDNSPMYDGEFFSKQTHQMQMYDVGFSALAANEAYLLATVVEGQRPEIAASLRSFGDAVASDIRMFLWMDDLKVYANRFLNGTMYPRVSPTSFYPFMLPKAYTTEIATATAEAWLLNSTRMCLSASWPQNNSATCYWGLPSISADDVAFPPLGYWRGYVWGPMAQLTYWAISRVSGSEAMTTARKALVHQMRQMGMNMWLRHRHVCENYSPHADAPECTGTKFYHWGALTVFLSVQEEGFKN